MYKEVLAGEKKTGQTALSPKVILCYDETKKYAQPFYNTNTTRRNEHSF